MQAIDNGIPRRSDSNTITINIVRNQGPPVFTQNANYFTTIDEDLPVFSSVLTVSATDSDASVSYYLYFSADEFHMYKFVQIFMMYLV